MSKQWQKYLNGLSKKEQQRLFKVIQKILKKDFSDLDIKPLVGKNTMFRCRIGNLRILFEMQGERVIILKLRPRGDIY